MPDLFEPTLFPKTPMYQMREAEDIREERRRKREHDRRQALGEELFNMQGWQNLTSSQAQERFHELTRPIEFQEKLRTLEERATGMPFRLGQKLTPVEEQEQKREDEYRKSQEKLHRDITDQRSRDVLAGITHHDIRTAQTEAGKNVRAQFGAQTKYALKQLDRQIRRELAQMAGMRRDADPGREMTRLKQFIGMYRDASTDPVTARVLAPYLDRAEVLVSQGQITPSVNLLMAGSHALEQHLQSAPSPVAAQPAAPVVPAGRMATTPPGFAEGNMPIPKSGGLEEQTMTGAIDSPYHTYTTAGVQGGYLPPTPRYTPPPGMAAGAMQRANVRQQEQDRKRQEAFDKETFRRNQIAQRAQARAQQIAAKALADTAKIDRTAADTMQKQQLASVRKRIDAKVAELKDAKHALDSKNTRLDDRARNERLIPALHLQLAQLREEEDKLTKAYKPPPAPTGPRGMMKQVEAKSREMGGMPSDAFLP